MPDPARNYPEVTHRRPIGFDDVVLTFEGGKANVCPACDGWGWVSVMTAEDDEPGVGSYRITDARLCEACDGTGKASVDEERCEEWEEVLG